MGKIKKHRKLIQESGGVLSEKNVEMQTTGKGKVGQRIHI